MEILNRFKEIISEKDKLVIFEFGTCEGRETNKMITILKQNKKIFEFHAFEADPRIISKFKQNNMFHLNNIILNECAIGNLDGNTTFFISSGQESRPGHMQQSFYGSSSIKYPKNTATYWPDMNFSQITTPIVKFDTYYKDKINNQIVDFIWADLQGAEGDLILGGQIALENTRYLYTEYDERELYEGEVGLNEIIKSLPGSWSIVEDYGTDVLLKNNKFE